VPVAPILQLLALLTVANGTPVIATWFFHMRGGYPLDGGVRWIDRQPLFGSSKTVRGVLLSLLMTSATAPLIDLSWRIGFVIASLAMAGDLLSSFIKRRLRLSSGSRVTGLDQIPESVLPLLACSHALALTAMDIAIVVASFFVGEIVVSRLLYGVHVRDRPY
jgi:CDP-2,3-bis-(O-geranylgeranyl)-sn-glycerol synthase